MLSTQATYTEIDKVQSARKDKVLCRLKAFKSLEAICRYGIGNLIRRDKDF